MRSLEEIIPSSSLEQIANQQKLYKTAAPYPHLVMDDFLTPAFAQELMRQFPDPANYKWTPSKSATQDRYSSRSAPAPELPPAAREVVDALNSAAFVATLEKLTGIDGIIPDTYLYDGGIEQTLPGGYLKLHVDASRHIKWNLDRVLNVVLYLNLEWKEEWGGALELWEGDGEHPLRQIRKVYPIGNRLLIFTSKSSWHGQPDPLVCPVGTTRNSILLRYYANPRLPENEEEKHRVQFGERSGEKFSNYSLREWIRDFTPPIVIRALKKSWRRLGT